MTKPTKIRARFKDNKIDFRMLMHHEMETGLRKDEKTGNSIPAWFIKEFSILLNGNIILSGNLGPTISKNPYLRCKIYGNVGDVLLVNWIDNKGNNRSDRSIVEI
ncbi:MAG: thiosulfate oxidation carrier complex protein SoxZ [Betaproteobacteria bacterium TMED156]|nr:MAG: thiosulfate oxidation carrier complex protein SoxZ [Betaproteobacteria bacterium TMED156]